ncbi:hypothetical protein HKX48_003345 [Thoreauomyces humboldtii]|nr:hypothetical protein HKX48_003345 [Thoreauomyces humboldtii]
MDKADSDFLHQLFRENNELRSQLNALQRELYNKTFQCESTDDELRQLKLRLEEDKAPASRPTTNGGHARKPGARISNEAAAPASTPSAAKDLAEALFTLERKSAEMKQLREDLAKLQSLYEEEMVKQDEVRRQMADVQEELQDLRNFRSNAQRDAEEALKRADGVVSIPDDIAALQARLDDAQNVVLQQKRQIMDIAADANKRHNEQQNQLQGVEALIEGVRREYDEFIEITKMENEAYRHLQQEEYNKLRDEFELHKREQFEEKKRLMTEYQGLLYSMQSQFDEYRTTSEFLFNTEAAKLEDELSSQAARYEQEIMYVIQAKDKFYADMMIAKDAKIMSLIEGSDLQNLMQKHEMDMEVLRKTHAREIDQLKTSQESEQKSLVSLLQRQNMSLESKCEKLQSHLKTLETRIKDLVGTVEAKNRTISDRDEAKARSESDFARKIEENNAKMGVLLQEKEHLRHKVIRMALDAKGEGHNSIENMLKRISRETNDLRYDYEGMSVKYNSTMSENQLLSKRLKEKEKFVDFLEKEVARRTEEFSNMTRTFEDFLSSRARQARKDRAKRLLKLHGVADESGEWDSRKQEYVDHKGILKAQIPAKELKTPASKQPPAPSAVQPSEKEERKAELERGFAYLRRFKTLSRAFASGDFRLVPAAEKGSTDNMPGNWQKNTLYAKLESANLSAARFYKEPPRDRLVKQFRDIAQAALAPGLKIYDEKEKLAMVASKQSKPGDGKEDKPMLMVGKVKHYKPTDSIAQLLANGLNPARLLESHSTASGTFCILNMQRPALLAQTAKWTQFREAAPEKVVHPTQRDRPVGDGSMHRAGENLYVGPNFPLPTSWFGATTSARPTATAQQAPRAPQTNSAPSAAFKPPTLGVRATNLNDPRLKADLKAYKASVILPKAGPKTVFVNGVAIQQDSGASALPPAGSSKPSVVPPVKPPAQLPTNAAKTSAVTSKSTPPRSVPVHAPSTTTAATKSVALASRPAPVRSPTVPFRSGPAPPRTIFRYGKPVVVNGQAAASPSLSAASAKPASRPFISLSIAAASSVTTSEKVIPTSHSGSLVKPSAITLAPSASSSTATAKPIPDSGSIVQPRATDPTPGGEKTAQLSQPNARDEQVKSQGTLVNRFKPPMQSVGSEKPADADDFKIVGRARLHENATATVSLQANAEAVKPQSNIATSQYAVSRSSPAAIAKPATAAAIPAATLTLHASKPAPTPIASDNATTQRQAVSTSSSAAPPVTTKKTEFSKPDANGVVLLCNMRPSYLAALERERQSILVQSSPSRSAANVFTSAPAQVSPTKSSASTATVPVPQAITQPATSGNVTSAVAAEPPARTATLIDIDDDGGEAMSALTDGLATISVEGHEQQIDDSEEWDVPPTTPRKTVENFWEGIQLTPPASVTPAQASDPANVAQLFWAGVNFTPSPWKG